MNIINDNFERIGFPAIIYSLIFTFCLYKNIITNYGITYPLFMASTIYMILRMLKLRGRKLDAEKKFYIIALMLLSVSMFTTASRPLWFLNCIFILFILVSFVISCLFPDSNWDLITYIIKIIKFFFKPLSYISSPFKDLSCYLTDHKKNKTSSDSSRITANIFKGILIALPFIVITVTLLSSADIVFKRIINYFAFDFITKINYSSFLSILFTIIFAFFFIYCLSDLIYSYDSKNVKCQCKNKSSVTAITFISLITVSYLVFSVIQIVFIFAGDTALPDDYTYSEYVHQGFYELVAVCAINLFLVSIVKIFYLQNRTLNTLMIVFSACTYIMMASAVIRMFMYIKAYRLTFARVLVLLFIFIMFIWFSALIINLLKKDFNLFKFFIYSAVPLYIIFAFSHPDYWIAKYDLYNMTESYHEYSSYDNTGDYDYVMSELSTDALPAIFSNKYAAKVYMESSFYGINFSSLSDSDKNKMINEKTGYLPNRLRSFNLSSCIGSRIIKDYCLSALNQP